MLTHLYTSPKEPSSQWKLKLNKFSLKVIINVLPRHAAGPLSSRRCCCHGYQQQSSMFYAVATLVVWFTWPMLSSTTTKGSVLVMHQKLFTEMAWVMFLRVFPLSVRIKRRKNDINQWLVAINWRANFMNVVGKLITYYQINVYKKGIINSDKKIRT